MSRPLSRTDFSRGISKAQFSQAPFAFWAVPGDRSLLSPRSRPQREGGMAVDMTNRTPRGRNEQAGNHRSHRQIRRHLEGGRRTLARRGRHRDQDRDEEGQYGDLSRVRNVLRRPARGAHRAQSANRYGNQDQGGKGSQIPSWKSLEGCSKLTALPESTRRSEMGAGFPVKGCLAQRVERRPYKANVGGSIPSAPTKRS